MGLAEYFTLLEVFELEGQFQENVELDECVYTQKCILEKNLEQLFSEIGELSRQVTRRKIKRE